MNASAKAAINGRFLTRRATGVDRYAREIILELDRIVAPGLIELVMPASGPIVEHLNLINIEQVRLGKFSGHLWEQFDYSQYLKKECLLGVNLCGSAPLINPGIVCIHDMAIRDKPDSYHRTYVNFYRLLYWFITKGAKKLVTVSDFSKMRIEHFYPYTKEKVVVIKNAWQHMDRLVGDESILSRNGLSKGSFYFAMSSLSPNKNLKWLAETARRNSNELVVIAGGMDPKVFKKIDVPDVPNIKYLGYINDDEAKTLMKNCRAFLYPTFYEGFGIPPLEALSCRTPIIVSDIPALRENYNGVAAFINPEDPNVDLSHLYAIANTKYSSTRLNKYDWASSAAMLYHEIKEIVR